MILHKVKWYLVAYVLLDLLIGYAGVIPLGTAAAAQFTTVTGTVVDPNGLAYANGTIVSVLILPGGTSPTLGGLPYTPPTQPVGLDATGSFTIQLADNTQLQPGGTTWNFTVCSAIGTVQPAGGKGPVCFTLASPITISGTSQSITANLNAAALALSTRRLSNTYFGTCGGVAAAASTTGVVNLGLTPASGSCASPPAQSNGVPISHNCTLANLQVLSSGVGVNASDGVATIKLNAGSTALTCTIGTGTSCSDTTHTVSATAGQQLWISIAAQAATTLANLAVSVDCQ
jgi:hypothetical protein